MTNESTTVVLGIPIPSTDPLFLAIVGVHDLVGTRRGTTYFWFLSGVFVTMSALSFMRWAENNHLFILGVLSFASALFGRTAVRRRWHQWPKLHLTAMGT